MFGLSPKVTGDPCRLPFSLGSPFDTPTFPRSPLYLVYQASLSQFKRFQLVKMAGV